MNWLKSLSPDPYVLAILATVGGLVGISTAFTGGKEVGGRLNIVHWLNPVIWNPTTKSFHVDEPLTPAQEAKIAEAPHLGELGTLPSPPERAAGLGLTDATSNAGGDCARASCERAMPAIALITANRFKFEDVTDHLGRVYRRSGIWLR